MTFTEEVHVPNKSLSNDKVGDSDSDSMIKTCVTFIYQNLFRAINCAFIYRVYAVGIHLEAYTDCVKWIREQNDGRKFYALT